ncbi:MAG: anthranilate phosphoribosyltransferase [Rhodoglobus sp.]
MVRERNWPEILVTVIDGRNLSVSDAEWAMLQVMEGAVTSAQLASFLTALRMKGETVHEVLGFRDAVLSQAVRLDIPSAVLDIVGTGGDPYGAVLNISSVAAIVASAAGVPVVKHGNRAASSASGASDVLAALGLNLEISPERIARVFDEIGIAFAFASQFHPGFRHAALTRKELGISTVFNILGPLCNPVRPQASAVGVASLERVPLLVEVFRTSAMAALIYRGDDGIDKLTTTGPSRVWEMCNGVVREHHFDPAELGIPRADVRSLLGADPQHNAGVIRRVLAGDHGPARDAILLNTAAGLLAFDLVGNPGLFQKPLVERLALQYERAAETVDSGRAERKLSDWVAATNV